MELVIFAYLNWATVVLLPTIAIHWIAEEKNEGVVVCAAWLTFNIEFDFTRECE